MKAVASLALLGLAYTFEDNEFVVASTAKGVRPLPTTIKFNSFEDTDNELALVGLSGFSQKNHHTLGRNVQRRTQLDDENTELYSLPTFQRQPRGSNTHTIHHDDDEFAYLPPLQTQNSAQRSIRIIQHDDNEFTYLPPIEIQPRIDPKINKPIHFDDNEFFNEELLEQENKDTPTKPENFKNLVKNVLEIIKEISENDDIADNVFCQRRERGGNSIYDLAHHVGQLDDDDDDDFLVSLGNLIQDGLNIYNDIKNKDYGNVVDDGVQAIKDVKRNKKFLGF